MTSLRPHLMLRAARLRHEMVAGLVEGGALRSPQWIDAFDHVPRHDFVPSFYEQTPSSHRRIDSRSPDEWLTAVYSDTHLLIRDDASSSSTAPSLMAVMLEALDPNDHDRVLEVGTGSGYNTALLCRRLGDRNVTTIDIDRQLIDDAHQRLSGLGYRPSLVTGDGAAGWSDNAPYDRLIATCAVESIPYPWLNQTKPGGRIVAPIATGIAVLTVESAQAATGRFLHESAYFMPLRGRDQPVDVDTVLKSVTEASVSPEPTDVGAEVWFDNGFQFLLALALPGLQFLTRDAQGGATFAHRDGSWARVLDGLASQGGKRRVWDEVAHTYQLWNEFEHPGRERFTYMLTPGRQRVCLQGTVHTWDIIP